VLVTKIVLVFCLSAFVLAATGDLLILVAVRVTHGFYISVPNRINMNLIPLCGLSSLWVLSLLLGWFVARWLGLIPRF
jgi:hypothetical protein